jgi:hypothetical protein
VVRTDGTPALIDFQAALRTDVMPRRLRVALEDLDMSGVLKKWRDFQGESPSRSKKVEAIKDEPVPAAAPSADVAAMMATVQALTEQNAQLMAALTNLINK